MPSPRRIIGISLLKNEEYFSLWSLGNVLDFCDELIIVDNGSTDRTTQKISAFAERHPGVSLHTDVDANDSHRLVSGHAGKDVWVFGVDGDEIYDPVGLVRLRQRILNGEFQDYWTLSGYMLHARRVDLQSGLARGHITPHTPRGNKLHNFSALVSWEQPGRQRLHGHSTVFRDGFSLKDNLDLFAGESWDSCDLRALHLCFFRRSSHDNTDPAVRRNPSTLRVKGIRRIQRRMKDFLAAPFSKRAGYKVRRYARGPIVRRDISAFGRPTHERYGDPHATEAETVLAPEP